jgi:hypothetical protein
MSQAVPVKASGHSRVLNYSVGAFKAGEVERLLEDVAAACETTTEGVPVMLVITRSDGTADATSGVAVNELADTREFTLITVRFKDLSLSLSSFAHGFTVIMGANDATRLSKVAELVDARMRAQGRTPMTQAEILAAALPPGRARDNAADVKRAKGFCTTLRTGCFVASLPVLGGALTAIGRGVPLLVAVLFTASAALVVGGILFAWLAHYIGNAERDA